MKLSDFVSKPDILVIKPIDKYNLLTDILRVKFDQLLKFSSQKLSSTFCDIISSEYNSNRSGFSGTPYFNLPYDINNTKYMKVKPNVRDIDQGQIYYSVYNPEFKKIYGINESKTKNLILAFNLKLLKITRPFLPPFFRLIAPARWAKQRIKNKPNLKFKDKAKY